MADDGRLPAELAANRDRNEERIRVMAYTEHTVEHHVAEGDVRRLAKALEAALKLIDDAKPAATASPADCTNECGYGPCNCSGVGRPLAWDLDPAALRYAITSALTGTETT